MTPALAKKIAEVSDSLPSLKKSTRNNEANFNYASIDDYYADIATKVREGGLIWTICENGCDFVHLDNEWYAKFRYLFRLYDYEMVTIDVDGISVPDMAAIELSLIHPLQGAQTTGSAMSYAEKLFLRTMFKIVTGEPDADAFARGNKKFVARKISQAEIENNAFDDDEVSPPPVNTRKPEVKREEQKPVAQKAPPAQRSQKTQDDADLPPPSQDMMFEAKCNVVIGALSEVNTKLELKSWKDEFQARIDELKEKSPAQYSRIEEAFADKVAELKAAGKK